MTLRKCTVEGKKAYFHKWNTYKGVTDASHLIGGAPAGQIEYTLGLVEYEDGTVTEVAPQMIIFAEHSDWIFCRDSLPPEPKEKIEEIEDIEGAILVGAVTEYIVTIAGAFEPTALYYAGDGYWYDEVASDFCNVVAWQPFPEPLKQEMEWLG